MAATFNASPLPQGFSRVQGLSKPAAASAGSAAPAGGADSASSLATHIAAPNPHTQYSLLNSAPTFTGNVTAPGFVGNASTATKLVTARLINGIPFDGTADITIAGGGGGGGGPVSPDSLPIAANAADDEFEFGASIDIAGARRAGATVWAWDNQGTSTAVIDNGALRFVPQLVAGTNHRGVQQAAPGGTWRYRAKIRTMLCVASQAVIYVTRGTRYLKFGFSVTFAGNQFQVFVQRLSNTTTVDSTPYLAANTTAPDAWKATTGSSSPTGYFEIEYDGTTLFFRFSGSGYNGDFRLAHSEAAATFLLGAPTSIGLSAQPNSATVQQQMIVDWFRRLA